MSEDFFSLWSDVRFLKIFLTKFDEFHALNLRRFSRTEEERNIDLDRADKLYTYLNCNIRRMRYLAKRYIGIAYANDSWIDCSNQTYKADALERYKRYHDWGNKTFGNVQSCFNERKKYFLLDAFKRITSIPFVILEAIIGFDIRKQSAYQKWGTIIIMGVIAVILINREFELVEKVVSLWVLAKP